jgi:hypothetical protein
MKGICRVFRNPISESNVEQTSSENRKNAYDA